MAGKYKLRQTGGRVQSILDFFNNYDFSESGNYATLNAFIAALNTKDDQNVKLTTEQTITGKKTFLNGKITFEDPDSQYGTPSEGKTTIETGTKIKIEGRNSKLLFQNNNDFFQIRDDTGETGLFIFEYGNSSSGGSTYSLVPPRKSGTIALDNEVVHKGGTETVTGSKLFTNDVTVGSPAIYPASQTNLSIWAHPNIISYADTGAGEYPNIIFNTQRAPTGYLPYTLKLQVNGLYSPPGEIPSTNLTQKLQAKSGTIALLEDINSTTNLQEITWAELKDLRDNSQLIPGKFYRITDYQCTTIAYDTSSAGHQFDIIVRADSINQLNEQASAIQHTGDTYFTDSKLEAWRLWYCLDNDFSRFGWADGDCIIISNSRYYRDSLNDAISGSHRYVWTTNNSQSTRRYTDTPTPSTSDLAYPSSASTTSYPISGIQTNSGTGVIYRMIDEFSNDCPYDFKNILFTKAESQAFPASYTNAYTFSYTENSTIKDASIIAAKRCFKNKIHSYLARNKHSDNIHKPQLLAFIVFCSTTTEFNCYENIITNSTAGNGASYASTASSALFRNGCFGNIIGGGSYNIIFNANCSYNTVSNNNYRVIFGENCKHNILGDDCYRNTFGNSCSYNILVHDCQDNTFGNSCANNKFEGSDKYNTFGNNCSNNIFGISCQHNTFGNNCSYITFASYCWYNNLGDSTAAIDYCQYITVGCGCFYVDLKSSDTSASSSNQLQYINIHAGVRGTNSNNRLTITIPDRNLTYETNIVPVGTTTIEVQ